MSDINADLKALRLHGMASAWSFDAYRLAWNKYPDLPAASQPTQPFVLASGGVVAASRECSGTKGSMTSASRRSASVGSACSAAHLSWILRVTSFFSTRSRRHMSRV